MKAHLPLHNRWLRRGAVAVLLLLLLWLTAWLAVPPVLKGQLQRIASEKLGREVTVGSVDFRPWTLELTLNELRVAGVPNAEPQLAVRRIHVDAELQSILRLAPVIDAVAIEAPTVRLTHLADGRYDIDDIIEKLTSVPARPAGDPARFSVNNIAISEGSMDFDDQAVGRRHELRDFKLDVPFLSNLDSRRDVDTEPRLAFRLNGSEFDSNASTTPFAPSRRTDARLKFRSLDLAPYLPYLPASLPFRLQAGVLDADLRIDFARGADGGLKITGTAQARGAKLADVRSGELASFDSIKVMLTDVRPLAGVIHLGDVALAAPRLKISRDESGRLNLAGTEPAGAAPAVRPDASHSAAPAGATKAPLRVQVDRFVLNGGQIGWLDATTRPAAAIDAQRVNIEASAIAWPMTRPAQFKGSAEVAGASIEFQGQATDRTATVRTEVGDLPLSLAAPYLARSLVPTLDGKLGGRIDVAWDATQLPARLDFKAQRVTADGLALTQTKTALASVGRFELVDAEVDMAAHRLSIGAVTATNPKVRIERDNERRWMFERWLRAPAANASEPAAVARVATPKAEDGAPAPAGSNTSPWQLAIGTVNVDGGAVSFADQSSATPVAVEITALKLTAGRIAPGTATASPVQLSARIGAGRAEAGRFGFKGTVALKPLVVAGALDIAAFPAHAFKAYYGGALNLDIRRAFASYRGDARFAMASAGPTLRLAGNTAVEDFRANSAALTQSQSPGLERGNNQLLSWKALNLSGFELGMAPGKPLSLDVRETTLTDFFARVIVDANGRVNLQELGRKAPAGGTAPPVATAMTPPTPAALAATPTVVTQRKLADGETVTTAAPANTGASAPAAEGGGSAAAAQGPAAILNFGPMNLVNGKIDFTDLFVKPNYSADLSELTGKLSAFSSRPGEKPALADLELRGKAQQTASLEISGKINPVAKPLELDLTARMRDLDLAPLTPYSVRFAGHGIERGKLSMDINYKISPDGRLAATNKLVLNQLRFGEEVQGAPTSLPVRLAVALLADRNGVIDVEVPISGSLNDPQFSVGSLILRALGNLVVKAVTAPFSLLANGLGRGSGGAEASAVAFEPGSAVLAAPARETLDRVASALVERPALQMTVVGTANLEAEREGYRRQRLRLLAQAEKRRAAARSGDDAADVAPITDAEYPALLGAVYKRSEVTKPRNLIGMAKELSLAEMEALLMPDIRADEESMRQLAVARGAAVRDYLLSRKLPSERLFLGAARVQGSVEQGWKPSAQLNLATR